MARFDEIFLKTIEEKKEFAVHESNGSRVSKITWTMSLNIDGMMRDRELKLQENVLLHQSSTINDLGGGILMPMEVVVVVVAKILGGMFS